MNDTILRLPFVLNDKHGTVEVNYTENRSPAQSGFDLLQGLGFDVNQCIGYPTMHAAIKEYAGMGYAKLCAWIQFITDDYYSTLHHTEATKVITEVDGQNTLRELGVPFFAFGSPAEIYDAPCNNLGEYARLKWVADTFLVTLPSPINNDTISYLAGFRWGYEEWQTEEKREVRILPLEAIDRQAWEKHLPMIREEFPAWQYQ